MGSWWNSPEIVSTASSVARWAGAIIAAVILILGHRLAKLQGLARAGEEKKTSEALAALAKKDQETMILASALEGKQLPRTISPEQREKFITALAGTQKGAVRLLTCSTGDMETKEYAAQLRLLFLAAGFETGTEVGTVSAENPPKGVVMFVKDSNTAPPFASEILRAFTVIGIPLQAWVDASIPDIQDAVPSVIVGARQ